MAGQAGHRRLIEQSGVILQGSAKFLFGLLECQNQIDLAGSAIDSQFFDFESRQLRNGPRRLQRKENLEERRMAERSRRL